MKPRARPHRVLVVRNDKLGDLVLALPVFALLRRALPDVELCALVPAYTAEIAALAPGVDRVLLDPGPERREGRAGELAAAWRAERFDLLLAVFSTTRIGLAAWRAGIPWRVGPATKLARIFYDDGVVQRRSRSEKPEFEYDLDLARHVLRRLGLPADGPLQRPVLSFPAAEVAERRTRLAGELGLDPARPLVFLHAGSGGSANNLTPAQYTTFANAVGPSAHQFVLTAGPGEVERTRALASTIHAAPAAVYESRRGLADFARVIATADVFVGGSTGPLHLAGALNRPTVGFYPRRATSSPLRWCTLAADDRRLAYAPPEPAHERDMSAVDPIQAARELRERFLS